MSAPRGEFAIGGQPRVGDATVPAPNQAANFDALGELPRAYNVPLLVAIARDPHTLFAYWEVDWPEVFQQNPPRERAVYLRVLTSDDAEESLVAVEPLAGSCYLNVAGADTDYRVELGYYDSDGEWKSVIASERVITPRDTVEQSAEFQLVTVPLHLSFQRLVDIFRGSKFDGRAMSDAIAELQQRFEDGESAQRIPAEHAQLIEALQWSLSPGEANQRAAFRKAAREKPMGRARLERILGCGAASPSSSESGGGRS